MNVHDLPESFCERMKKLLGDEYPAFEEAMSRDPVKGFRVNTKKLSVEDFLKLGGLSGERIPFSSDGFFLSEEKVGGHPFHHAGMIYVQEPSAMMPVECVDVDPSWNVLDLCAAPGGKTSQLRSRLSGGVLVSNEIVPQRCRVLTGNIERLGFENVVSTCTDPPHIAAAFPGSFDLVNVDAPCSGEGMFRKDPKAISEWSEENVKMCAERQSGILDNAAECVKDGGYLLYSTCTFSLEENEMNVASFLLRHEEFELVEVSERVKKATVDGVLFDGCTIDEIKLCRRFYPHRGEGEGQFAALFRRKSGAPAQRRTESILAPCRERVVFEFLDDVLENYEKGSVLMHKDTPVIFAPDFSLPGGLPVFSCGVTIGEIRGKYLKPHHQLFSALGKAFRRRIELDFRDERLKKYLKGETIEVDCPDGFAAVLCSGCPVGGGKAVGGKLKNHYPRGLRLIDG